MQDYYKTPQETQASMHTIDLLPVRHAHRIGAKIQFKHNVEIDLQSRALRNKGTVVIVTAKLLAVAAGEEHNEKGCG